MLTKIFVYDKWERRKGKVQGTSRKRKGRQMNEKVEKESDG